MGLTMSMNAPAKAHTHKEIMVILGGLMTGLLLAALDQTIVSTALKSITEDFNGLNHYTWVVTAYLLTSTASTPLYGKISDIWGLSSVAGPLRGGFFSDHETILGITGWRWIFYINIPFGILALVLTSATLHLAKQKRDHSIDYLGAVLLVTSVTLILLSLSVYGPQNGWTDSRTLGYLAIGVALATLFIWWEARAKEPIIPLSLFSNHTFSLTSILGFIIGAGMFGAIVMLPLYLQVVKGDSATSAGLKLIPLMLGIVSTSIISGKLISKHGRYKRFPIMGTAIMTLGILAMYRLEIDTPFWEIAIYAVMVGAGLGLSMQTIVIALQNSVDFKDMGIATSSNTFFRSLGSVFGTALFGAILSNRLGHYLIVGREDLVASNPSVALSFNESDIEKIKQNTAVIAQLPPEAQTTALNSFVDSFHVVFLAAAPLTAIGFFIALFLREAPLRTNEDYAAARQESAGEAVG